MYTIQPEEFMFSCYYIRQKCPEYQLSLFPEKMHHRLPDSLIRRPYNAQVRMKVNVFE